MFGSSAYVDLPPGQAELDDVRVDAEEAAGKLAAELLLSVRLGGEAG